MDWSLAFGILGTISSITFGVWGLFVIFQKPGKLVYLHEECIGLFESIIKNFPDISIAYKSNAINEQIFFLRGYLVNTGRVDVTQGMVEENLFGLLPDGYKWLDAKVVESSPSLMSKLYIEDDVKLKFDMGLFRRDEYIRFEALFEVPVEDNSLAKRLIEKNILSKIKFDHRIANISEVAKKEVHNSIIKTEDIFGYIMGTLVVVSILFAIAYSGLKGIVYPYKPSQTVKYYNQLENGDRVRLNFDFNKDGSFLIKGDDKKFREILTLEEFIDQSKKWAQEKNVKEKSPLWGNYLVVFIFGGLGVVFMVLILLEIRQKYKLYKILNEKVGQ